MELDERKKVIIKKIPDIHIDEILMIVRVTMDFELEKIDDFLLLYTARRKKPEIFRQYTLLGFIGIRTNRCWSYISFYLWSFFIWNYS